MRSRMRCRMRIRPQSGWWRTRYRRVERCYSRPWTAVRLRMVLRHGCAHSQAIEWNGSNRSCWNSRLQPRPPSNPSQRSRTGWMRAGWHDRLSNFAGRIGQRLAAHATKTMAHAVQVAAKDARDKRLGDVLIHEK